MNNNELEILELKDTGFSSVDDFNFPNIVNVNVFSGRCYCNCIHCPVGVVPQPARQERFRQAGINLNLFKKIVDEISVKRPSAMLRIHSVGEPTMWDELPQAVKYAKEKGVKTWIFSCAVSTDQELLRVLCDNVNIIEISVNSIDSKDYLQTKGIDAFATVIANIKFMAGYKATNQLPTRLIVSRVQSDSQKADEKFVQFWKDSQLVDDAFVRSFHSYNDLLAKTVPDTESKKAPCLVHWARFNIDLTGEVVVCFNELFKESVNPNVVIGNINQESIANIWQGKTLKAIRQAELSGDYSQLAHGDELPCVNCHFCQPLHSTRQTSDHQVKIINQK